MKVLLAEDDELTRQGLAEVLASEGFQVVQAANGAAAIEQFAASIPDFVCLDIMMPGRSGYDVCRSIRATHPDIPIIFISAKSEEIDKIVGFELGADDFIVKPFGVREVVARIRAVTRRCHVTRGADPTASFTMDDLQVFPAELRAIRNGQAIELSLRDVQILELLHRNAGRVLDRNVIFNHAWGEDYFPNSRTLDQHISQLRKRIEADPKSPQIIRTVHGAGYRYEAE
ncbi:MAG: response regulator transcription factor [Planctomycetaceae bacterium]|jgi:DNA-binding response OmpR family regulator|nr:response regulator transcription factor [Planctomycetaceae bacterium]